MINRTPAEQQAADTPNQKLKPKDQFLFAPTAQAGSSDVHIGQRFPKLFAAPAPLQDKRPPAFKLKNNRGKRFNNPR
jgi:hypothetical protein